jgi:4-alpha-glucanotransferase
MKNERASGLLCHISSLPSAYGIGDLGPEAYGFVDLLAKARQKYWQVLPLNPTDGGMSNSPYSSYSAFGANTLFISPELLLKDGLLTPEDLLHCRLENEGAVAYDEVYDRKAWMIGRAHCAYKKRWLKSSEFEDYCKVQDHWLADHALFVVIKRRFHNVGWIDWPKEYRDRDPEALQMIAFEAKDEILREKFAQFLFSRQWRGLQNYCSRRGISLFGDIPIYVNYDSADVWKRPDLFKLDAHKRPIFVAGVPPDYFSKDGQRWGNPVFDWERIKESGFEWWIERVRHNLMFFDLVRIDHFRAFAQCWEIPAEEPTAIGGAWRDVPGVELFTALNRAFPELPIVAEDLGIITPDVDALKDRFGLPGMRVLMFAFHNEYKKSRDLPENYKPLSVVYTGTHDNNTIGGWYAQDITAIEKKNMKAYFGRDILPEEINWVMISVALKSSALLSIIPLQDVLGLGAEARMNTPSTFKGNWRWRMLPGALTSEQAVRLAGLTQQTQR